jgi:phosphopantothenoylcysteine decarboxylase/phosphopantothenate--cysteine ligase
VVNAVGEGRAFEVAENEAVLLAADGGEVPVPYGPKAALAAVLWDQVAARLS